MNKLRLARRGENREPLPGSGTASDSRAMHERGAMAKAVRRATDLPIWFDLKKYSRAVSLDAAGWYEQLTVRKWLMDFMDCRDEYQKPLLTSELEMLDLTRTMPIVDATANPTMKVYFYDGVMHEHRTGNPVYSFGVRLSTVRDFYLIEGRIEPEKRQYAHKFFAQFANSANWLDESFEFRFPCADWIDEPIDNISNATGNKSNVLVDFGLPDKVLIEQFKALLQGRRRQLSDSSQGLAPNRRAIFSDWIAFGVLPFIDLKIWERETGAKIPNRVMADAIFPAGEGGEEVVRKTTSKIATELLSDGSLKFLASIASQRIAEANSG